MSAPPTAGPITLRLTVFSGDGGSGISQVLPEQVLQPGGFVQISGILASNGLSLNNGYVRVERISGTAPYYAYGVINDQANSDGSFIPPVPENMLAGKTRLTLPVVVETGRLQHRIGDDELVFDEKDSRFQLCLGHDSGTRSNGELHCDINPSSQLIWPDLVQRLRDAQTPGIGSKGTGFAGALFVTVGTGDLRGVSVSARTSALGDKGRYGLFYSALPDGANSTGEGWLYGLQQNSENRTNLALVNTGESGTSSDTFRIELFDGNTGQPAGTVDNLVLGASRWTQINTILSQYAPGVTQGYARITRTSGASPFIAYAVINDGGQAGQRSGDGAYIVSSE